MSTRPPPFRAADRPPSYRMVTRVYNNSLRPIVVVIGCVAAIWALIWAIPAFQDINDDNENKQPKFATFDIVLGVIYISACAIELLGVFAAASQRVALVRIYAMLSLIASVAVVAAGFLRVIIHFVYKSGLISECEAVVQGNGVEFRFGIWGPLVKEKLNPDQASEFCNNAWNRDSLDEILFLIFEIIFSIFFTMIAFAYYHQVLDPTSAANVSRTPAPAVPGAYPDHYNRPYDYDAEDSGFVPPYSRYDAPAYAPPPGPPPPDMGYGVGMGASRDVKDADLGLGDVKDADQFGKFDDPFADFDGPSKPALVHDRNTGSPPPHAF